MRKESGVSQKVVDRLSKPKKPTQPSQISKTEEES
jgi:hypothetical protein